MKTVRIGIIGFGSIGKVHMNSFKKLKNVEVVAVCDIDENELRYAKEIYGIENLYKDYHDLIARDDIDAVVVCLPNYLHSKVTIDALKEGKHVLCEKPPAITAKEVKEMFDVSKKYSRKLLIGLTMRFRDQTRVIKEYVSSGVLGEVYYAKCGYLRRSGIPGMGSWFTTKSKAGAGPLYDIGVHVLDLTLWIMGNFEADSVLASTYAKFGPRGKGLGGWGKPVPGGPFDVEDFATAFIKMRNGATVFLEVSWAAHVGESSIYSLILGDRGGVDYSSATVYTEEKGALVDKKLHYVRNDPYLAEAEHFVNCIIKDEEPITKAEEMIWLQAILESALKSAKEGRIVKVSEVL